MTYVIWVNINVPFLAHNALDRFIWNNFYPNMAGHLTNRIPKCAFGSAI